MNIKIDYDSKIPIYMQIANRMKQLIFSGELVTGSTLPSERATAKLLNVHRNTIAKAYNELKAEELIESKQGIGYIVAMPQTTESPQGVKRQAEQKSRR